MATPRRVVSRTHHIVSTDGHTWYKEPGPAPYATAALTNEAHVLALLERPHTWDGTTLTTPHLGRPLREDDVDVNFVTAMVEALTNAPTVTEDTGLPTAAQIPDRVTARAHARLDDRGCPHIVDTCLAWLEAAGPMLAGNQLVHTDPHTENWVAGAAGPVLIDWESAAVGPPAVDLAALWHSLTVIHDRPDLAAIPAGAASLDDLRPCLLVKSASALSWLAWKHGPDAAAARARRIRDAGERLGVAIPAPHRL